MYSVSTCETSSPPTTATPSGWRSSAPAPMPSAIGSAPMQGGQRRHHDRPEAQQAGLADRRRAAPCPRAARTSATSIIMIAFFLTMPISISRPIMRDHAQIHAEQLQRQQRADRRRRQAGQDGQRMDVALVEDAQHDVDRHHRRQQQHALVGQRLLEDVWALPAKVVVIVAGTPSSALIASIRCDRVAERHALRQVERERHRGQLAQLVDGERPRRALDRGRRRDSGTSLPDDAAMRTSSSSVGGPGVARVELHDHRVSCRRWRRWSRPAGCRSRSRASSAAARR